MSASNEYAEALFALAKEANETLEVKNGLEFVCSALKENPKFKDIISSPVFSKDEKRNSITAVFDKKVPDLVLRFVKLLSDNGRVSIIDNCFSEYVERYLTESKIAVAKVSSATELTENEKSKLKEKLEKQSGMQVEMHFTIDKNLLGGLLIEMNGEIIDGSIRTRLKKAKEIMK